MGRPPGKRIPCSGGLRSSPRLQLPGPQKRGFSPIQGRLGRRLFPALLGISSLRLNQPVRAVIGSVTQEVVADAGRGCSHADSLLPRQRRLPNSADAQGMGTADLSPPPPAAASGPEDVALYVGLVAVAVCLLLLLLVLILVYCRKKEGLDSDVADSSILTSGFQPVSIKPSKAGVVPQPPAPALGPMPGAPGPDHPQCHSLSLPLSCRQSPSAHHPARPQHHHHHLPGQPVSPAGRAQPQVPANQWAPAQPAEWRPPHAAPQLAHL